MSETNVPGMFDPKLGVKVAAQTRLNSEAPLFAIQTKLHVYVGSSLKACREMLARDEPGPTEILAAGPVSWDMRVYLVRLFESIGLFGADDDNE